MELKDIEELLKFDQEKFDEVIESHDQKRKVRQAFENEKQEIKDKMWEITKETLKNNQDILDKKIKDKEKEAEDYFLKRSKEIEGVFKGKKDQWLKELFDNCIV